MASLKVILMTIREALHSHRWDFKRYALLDFELLYGEAYNSLTPTGKDVLIRFLQKRTFFYKGKGKKNKEYINHGLVFTYQEAECFRISKSSFSRAINQLVEKGFIEIEYQGGSIGIGKDWSRYKLISDWKDYGTAKFETREKKKCVQYSDGLKRYNETRKKDSKTYDLKTRPMSSSSVIHDTHTVSLMTTGA
jgi:hypothetical protein